jgi:hypothetical protein
MCSSFISTGSAMKSISFTVLPVARSSAVSFAAVRSRVRTAVTVRPGWWWTYTIGAESAETSNEVDTPLAASMPVRFPSTSPTRL